jgi:arylformamidase
MRRLPTEESITMTIWDISLPISGALPTYLGDPSFKIRLVQRIDQGDVSDVSLVTMSAHIGTHVDAPSHLVRGGKTIDELSLNTLIGPSVVIDYRGNEAISRTFLENCPEVVKAERVLFRTRNSELWNTSTFATHYVGLAIDGARWLIDNGTKLIGIDYLSIDPPGNQDLPVHQALLSSGVVILEGLNLGRIRPGSYLLLCLPLNLLGGEGAPARAILLDSIDDHAI